MSENKRRDPRFESQQRLWCEGQPAAEARNMSRSGMFIVAEQALEVGEQLKISFEGEEGPVEANMEVMWSAGQGKPGGMGLRIVSFDKGKETYERFVDRELEKQGDPEDES